MPSMCTEPADGRRSHARMRSAVVFPAPFKPRKPTLSPLSMVNDSGPRTRRPPNDFSKAWARIMTFAHLNPRGRAEYSRRLERRLGPIQEVERSQEVARLCGAYDW